MSSRTGLRTWQTSPPIHQRTLIAKTVTDNIIIRKFCFFCRRQLTHTPMCTRNQNKSRSNACLCQTNHDRRYRRWELLPCAALNGNAEQRKTYPKAAHFAVWELINMPIKPALNDTMQTKQVEEEFRKITMFRAEKSLKSKIAKIIDLKRKTSGQNVGSTRIPEPRFVTYACGMTLWHFYSPKLLLREKTWE